LATKTRKRQNTEYRRRKTEDRRGKTGDRRQETEDRRQKMEDRRQETEDRRQKTEREEGIGVSGEEVGGDQKSRGSPDLLLMIDYLLLIRARVRLLDGCF
jgi:hypothetical protein